MLKVLRYAIATVCFAASVGCLAMWWRSFTRIDVLCGPSYVLRSQAVMLESIDGFAFVSMAETSPATTNAGLGTNWQHYSSEAQFIGARRDNIAWMKKRFGRFHFSMVSATVYFPRCSPDLPFSLAAAATVKYDHHFNCPTCKAAGRGKQYGQRCGAGMALWRAYSAA